MKKKKISKPKVRHVWSINPKTRVKDHKGYKRPEVKRRPLEDLDTSEI